MFVINEIHAANKIIDIKNDNKLIKKSRKLLKIRKLLKNLKLLKIEKLFKF